MLQYACVSLHIMMKSTESQSRLLPDNDLVSVIVPVYMVEEYVEECVLSVVNQSYESIELILVDDCGTDRSVEIAVRALKHASIKWKLVQHEQNRGLSAARNTGVMHASGKYIYFLDSDDYIAPTCISTMVAAIRKYKTPIAIGAGIVLLMPDGAIAPIWKDTVPDLHQMNPFRAYLRMEHNYTAWHRLIDLDAYVRTGITFREGMLHEDVVWSFEVARSGLPVCSAMGEQLYFYRQRDNSIMSLDVSDTRRFSAHMEIMRLFYRTMLNEGWVTDSDYRARYALLFREAISRVLSRKHLPMRERGRKIESIIREFDYIIPEIETQYRHLKLFLKLTRCMPAILAYRLAALVRTR